MTDYVCLGGKKHYLLPEPNNIKGGFYRGRLYQTDAKHDRDYHVFNTYMSDACQNDEEMENILLAWVLKLYVGTQFYGDLKEVGITQEFTLADPIYWYIGAYEHKGKVDQEAKETITKIIGDLEYLAEKLRGIEYEEEG